jgi:hypothetical protein
LVFVLCGILKVGLGLLCDQLANDNVAHRAREKRKVNAGYKATKTLGEADPATDDLAAWVKKTRVIEEKRRKKEKEAAARMARQLEQQVRARVALVVVGGGGLSIVGVCW